MSESAKETGREARRRATKHRIAVCAQKLAEDRGLDGFTMDDLAEVAGVSRRTLFNYFSGKDAAVLGGEPEIDPALLEQFVAGGPHGNLVDDFHVLLRDVISIKDVTREDVARVRRLLHEHPKLLGVAKQRFETAVVEFSELTRQREGAAYDEVRTRVVIHVLAALFDLALTTYLEQPDRELVEVYDETVRTTRSVFA